MCDVFIFLLFAGVVLKYGHSESPDAQFGFIAQIKNTIIDSQAELTRMREKITEKSHAPFREVNIEATEVSINSFIYELMQCMCSSADTVWTI